MLALSPRVLSTMELPPLPSSPGDAHLVLFDPAEGAYLLLVAGRKELWRVERDGTARQIASLTYPTGLDPRYLHTCAFYFDTKRRMPIFLASTYASESGDGLYLLAWDGSSLVPIPTKKGIRVAGSDSFAFDPERGVLVHFVGQRDTNVELDSARKVRGGLTVRELGAGGVWQDLDALLPAEGTYETYAAYEPRRRLTVLLDNGTHTTFGWDGESFVPLGDFPTSPWKPNVMVRAPGAGGLLFLQRKRTSDDYRALLWELGDDGWKARKAGTLEVFGGAAYDSARDETLIFGPWLGPGTVQYTWARYERGGLVMMGAAAPTITGGSTSGTPFFWGARDPGHGNYAVEVRRPYSALTVHEVVNGRLVPHGSCPPCIAMAAGIKGRLAVDSSGRVYASTVDDWSEISAPSPNFTERDNAVFGIDQEGRALLVGGEPCVGSKRLLDTWLFDGVWRALTPKGGAPLASDAFVARDESRKVWVVCGGTLKYLPNPKVHELTEKKWVAFAAQTADGASPGTVTLLAWDQASGQMLAVATADRGTTTILYVVRAGGFFEAVASLEGQGIYGVMAYDSTRRTIVAFCSGAAWEEGGGENVFAIRTKLAEVDVGAALDASRADTRVAAHDRRRKGPPSEPPPSLTLPDAIWLELREQEKRSYWFSTRTGTRVTIRSGRRGKVGTEKTTTHGSVAAARGAHEKGVAERLAAGYEHSPEKEGCATVPGKRSFAMKLGSKGEDSFGGVPVGIGKDRWPVCVECGCPMTHVMTLHRHVERLPLTKHAAVQVFVCGNEETAGACEVWEPDEGSNAVLLLTDEDVARPPLRAPPKGPDGEEASPPCKARKISYRELFEEDPEANENPEPIEAISKVSGYPGWLQFPDTPACTVCAKEMTFVAEVGELDEALNFAGGHAYVFCCPDECEARLLCQR